MSNTNVYPTNGFVIQDREGFRTFQYEETVKILKKKNSPKLKDQEYMKKLKLNIYGQNWIG